MKPNFALDLSHEGINLLHRSKGGWTLVGSVALDDADMGARLHDLRRSAAMLESGGFTSKIIIPNSQILYTTVDAAGPDDISREVQIRAALDGLTPYAVGDLVFDWRAEGDKARVAVLARETMDEAEAFASEYKFNPVSFVARPDRGDFSGEPFFGKTRAAARLLAPSARIEPDASPVPRNPRALELAAEARVDGPEQAAEPVRPPEPGDDAPAERDRPSVFADTVASDAAGPDEPSRPEEPGALPAEDLAREAPPAEPAFEADARDAATPAPRRKTRAERREAARVAPPALAPFPPTPDELGAALPPSPRGLAPVSRPAKSVRAPAAPREDAPAGLGPALPSSEKPAAPPEPQGTGGIQVPPSSDDSTGEGGAPETISEGAAPAAFQSRRIAASETTDVPARSGERLRETPARIGIAAAPPDSAARMAAEGEDPEDTPAVSATARPKPAPYTPELAASRAAMPPVDRIRADMADALLRPLPSPGKEAEKPAKGPALLSGLTDTARGMTARAGNGLKAAVNARTEARRARAAAKAETGQAHAEASAAQQADSADAKRKGLSGLLSKRKAPVPNEVEARRAREAEALTVFGARKTQDSRGRPKYLGLILTLLLLLAMAVLAVWSSYVVEDDVTLFNPDPGSVVALDPVPEDPAPDQPAADPEPTAPEAPAESAALLSPAEAEARYAATGIWQRAPEPLGEPESTRLATRDLGGSDATTTERAPLPDPGEIPGRLRDALLSTPVPPPPPGTSFDLDESGLVRPTPEGALSPTGILVYSGRPALVPPPRPADLPDVAPPFALPDVPDTRPRPRPADLVPPAAVAPLPDATPEAAPEAEVPPETDDNAALTPEGEAAPANEPMLADVRPAPRPENLVVSTASASAAIDAAVSDAMAAALVNATDLAVATSRKPSHRPSNFAAIVDAAREAASDGSRVAAAPATVEATPAVATAANVAPAIPTSASVATQATLKNAINLRDINLIGIYGTSSARRALVRMKNGRYVKVEVGDSLDGGRVTSITASELTYQKGSRAYKLGVLPLG